MELPGLFAVITLIVGWFLNEASRFLNIRHTKQRAVGLVIADLLEIRHELNTIQLMMNEMTRRFEIPAEHHPAFKKFVKSMLFQQENLSQRYGEAVTLIASSNPILGFRLRSKDQMGPYLQKLSNMVPNDEGAIAFFYEIETKLEKLLLPNIEKTVKDLAKYHGPVTFFRVWNLFRKPPSIPKELDDYFSDIEKQIESKPKNSFGTDEPNIK